MPKQRPPRVVLAEFESTCGACSQKKTPGVPMMPCPGCRLVHYCNDECQERDRAKHSVECSTLAVKGFRLMSSTLAGPGVSLKQWIDETTEFVTAYRMLPDKLTSRQVEELLARAWVAFWHDPKLGENSTYRELLGFWGTCVLRLRHETWDQEAYLSTVGELLDRLLKDGPCWRDMGEATTPFVVCGNVLCELDRASEAVELGRRMKRSMEEDMQTHGDASGLNVLLAYYGIWLYELAMDKEEGAEKLEALKEAEAALDHALDMLQGHEPANVAPALHLQLTRVLIARDAFDEALKVAQRGMQSPSQPQFHAALAQHAIDCLMMLRRYDQAEPLIVELLAKARRHLKLLTKAGLGTLHFHHGVLLARRGDYAKAHTAFSKAEFYISQVDKATQEQHGVLLEDVVLQKMDILDRTGKVEMAKALEKQLGFRAMVRPSSFVSLAREARQMGVSRVDTIKLLDIYMQEYDCKGYWWQTRTRWQEGDDLKPLELLRDLLDLEERSEESAKVEALIERSRTEDEELRQQALEELRQEMREGRAKPDGGIVKGPKGRSRGSKASRKKRKKRERKRQQQQRHCGNQDQAAEANVDLVGLSINEEGGTGGGEEEQPEPDECPMCFQPFGEDEDQSEQEEAEEVLGCGHRFHDVCIDRWLCKCKEKGLLPTCPMCRSELVRGGGGRR